MSEVDRLSNSGLYPTLPIADKHPGKDQPGKPPPDSRGGQASGQTAPAGTAEPDPKTPRPPKSLIDEYA
jgi:hypothetical protein